MVFGTTLAVLLVLVLAQVGGALAMPLADGAAAGSLEPLFVNSVVAEQPKPAIALNLIAGMLLAVAVLLAGLIPAGLAARRRAQLVAEMSTMLERLTRGELSVRLEKPASAELAPLGRALNRFAGQLEDEVAAALEPGCASGLKSRHGKGVIRTALSSHSRRLHRQGLMARQVTAQVATLSSNLEIVATALTKSVGAGLMRTSEASVLVKQFSSELHEQLAQADAVARAFHELTGVLEQLEPRVMGAGCAMEQIEQQTARLAHVGQQAYQQALSASVDAVRVDDQGKGFVATANQLCRMIADLQETAEHCQKLSVRQRSSVIESDRVLSAALAKLRQGGELAQGLREAKNGQQAQVKALHAALLHQEAATRKSGELNDKALEFSADLARHIRRLEQQLTGDAGLATEPAVLSPAEDEVPPLDATRIRRDLPQPLQHPGASQVDSAGPAPGLPEGVIELSAYRS